MITKIGMESKAQDSFPRRGTISQECSARRGRAVSGWYSLANAHFWQEQKFCASGRGPESVEKSTVCKIFASSFFLSDADNEITKARSTVSEHAEGARQQTVSERTEGAQQEKRFRTHRRSTARKPFPNAPKEFSSKLFPNTPKEVPR